MLKAIAAPVSLPEIPSHLSSFAGCDYRDSAAFQKMKAQIERRSYPRREIATILYKYNTFLNNDTSALNNIEALNRADSTCIITGQQLGLMGGPAYTILKGITCVALARSMGAIPLFWLATEDHDIAEIDHTFLVDRMGNLKRFRIPMRGKHIAVENLVLTSNHIAEIDLFWKELGIAPSFTLTAGEPYAKAMAQVLVNLFKGTGLAFLEPKLLRPFAAPFFEKELTDCDIIASLLSDTAKKLSNAGGKPLLTMDNGPNLFLFSEEGRREKLKKIETHFIAGKQSYSLPELIALVHTHPERFSTNAAARPVFQNSLLPTIAYVGGPAELDYHLQLNDYHSYHQTSMASLVPRLSATLLSPAVVSLLEGYHLNPWDELPTKWNRPLPQNIPGNGLHTLHNWLHPHNQRQERVLNWWGFQAGNKHNLILDILKTLPPLNKHHQFIYYS